MDARVQPYETVNLGGDYQDVDEIYNESSRYLSLDDEGQPIPDQSLCAPKSVDEYRGYTLPYETKSIQNINRNVSHTNTKTKEPSAVQAVTLVSDNYEEPKGHSRVFDDEQDDDKYVTIDAQDVNTSECQRTVSKRNVDSNPDENDAGDEGYSMPDELYNSMEQNKISKRRKKLYIVVAIVVILLGVVGIAVTLKIYMNEIELKKTVCRTKIEIQEKGFLTCEGVGTAEYEIIPSIQTWIDSDNYCKDRNKKLINLEDAKIIIGEANSKFFGGQINFWIAEENTNISNQRCGYVTFDHTSKDVSSSEVDCKATSIQGICIKQSLAPQ